MLNLDHPITSLHIHTERLLLRPLVLEDAAAILFIRSNDIVNKYIDRPKSITIEDANKFIAKISTLMIKKESFYWAIILKETNELIGTICYFNINSKKCSGEIGYELHPDHHNKGIMQEAIEKIIDFGFNLIGFKILTALVSPENKRSIHVLEKNHFLPDTRFKYVVKKDSDNLSVYYLLNTTLSK